MKIAALLFAITALLWALQGQVAMCCTFVCIAMMFLTIGSRR